MKRRTSKTYVPMPEILLVAIVTVLMNNWAVNAQTAQKPTDAHRELERKEYERKVDAARRGDYRELARIQGQYVGTVNVHWDWVSFDTEALTKHSAAVVVGVPTRSKAQISEGDRLIITEYEVAVHEVIKGKINQGDIIKVRLPGGKVEFEDGTSAELKTPGFEGMTNKNAYLLFLSATGQGSDEYALTAGPQGLFELPTDGTAVEFHGRPADPGAKDAKDKDVPSFLEHVRRQSVKWPEPGKCCD